MPTTRLHVLLHLHLDCAKPVPLNQIEANVVLAKKLGHNAPLYFLGPLVTDIAPGYDHITSSIGGAIAAS
ncbi:hypothetical protein AGMMS49921_10180 [Endomicrobiia bacterium]|nr:hypothetical protein AGMMS49921_10180 [Endomicrobiia bacterium]